MEVMGSFLAAVAFLMPIVFGGVRYICSYFIN